MLVVQRDTKKYEGADGLMVVIAKPWRDGEVMLDFFYQDNFIKYIHVKMNWSDIVGFDTGTAFILAQMEENDKLKSYVSIFKAMKPLREDMLLEEQPPNNPLLLQFYVAMEYNKDVILRVDEASVYCRQRKRRLHKETIDAQTFGEIFNHCSQYADMLPHNTNNRCTESMEDRSGYAE